MKSEFWDLRCQDEDSLVASSSTMDSDPNITYFLDLRTGYDFDAKGKE